MQTKISDPQLMSTTQTAQEYSENNSTVCIACVAWRFCRAGRRTGVAAKFAREARENERRSREKNTQIASAPISSRFLCPRPPLLLSAPKQNRHATQATVCMYSILGQGSFIDWNLPVEHFSIFVILYLS